MKKIIAVGSLFKNKRSGKFIQITDTSTDDYVTVCDCVVDAGKRHLSNNRLIQVATLLKNYEPTTEIVQDVPSRRKRYQPGDVYHSRRSDTHIEIVEDDGTNVIIREVEAKLVVVYSAVEGSERVVKSSSVASSYYK